MNMRSSGIVSISVSVSILAERAQVRKAKQTQEDDTVDCAVGVAVGVTKMTQFAKRIAILSSQLGRPL